MNRILCLILLASVVLGGCNPTPRPEVSPTPQPVPTQAPTLTNIILPTASATTAPSPTPVPSLTPSATLAPSPTLGATTGSPGPGVKHVEPDCTQFPAFGSCGLSLPLTGKLAALDAARQQILVVDFGRKEAWTAPAGRSVSQLDWLESGGYLAVTENDGKQALVWTSPQISKPPKDALRDPGQPVVFSSTNGSTAWLERKGTQAVYHIRVAGSTAETIWTVEMQDRIPSLLGWVPDTVFLLGGYHFGGNSMWVTGNQLYTLDTRSGKIAELPASMLIDSPVLWWPAQRQTLALRNTANGAGGQLALLDVSSGKLQPVFSDMEVPVGSLAWTLDGQNLVFSVPQSSLLKPGSRIAQGGIYLSDASGKTVRRLTSPAGAENDDLLKILPDLKSFLYMRQAVDGKTAELRLGTFSGAQDARVAANLAAYGPAPSGARWSGIVTYQP